MNHHDEFESLEEVFDDVVPTDRRPRAARSSTLVPPPSRLAPGEERHVDMKSILSEPPRVSIPAVDPLPRFHELVEIQREDEWALDPTPPPMSSDLGSVAPTYYSEAPRPTQEPRLPAHAGWKVATGALAAALLVSLVAVFAPLGSVTDRPTQSLAAPAAQPPLVSIHDLPVVGTVQPEEAKDTAEEPDIEWVTVVKEVAIRSEVGPRERNEMDTSKIEDERMDRDDVDRSEPTPETTDTRSEEATGSEERETAARDDGEAPSPPAVLSPFDRTSAESAMNAAAAAATSCRQPGSPAGASRVSVTFAPTGRVTTATVSGAFAGTPTGGCIARTFRSAQVPPFDGNLVTVHKTVAIR